VSIPRLPRVLIALAVVFAGFSATALGAGLHWYYNGGIAPYTGKQSGVVVSPGTNGFGFDNYNSGTNKIEVRFVGSTNTGQWQTTQGAAQWRVTTGYVSNASWLCYNNSAGNIGAYCAWRN